MDIFLVRHGEAASTWTESEDPGLSLLGRRQAADAAGRLIERLDNTFRLVSSPLRRAQETAAPLAAALKLDVSINPVFQEIPAPVPMAERQRWLQSVMRQRWSEQEGTVSHWRAALLDSLQRIPQPAVVFTHFMVINAVVGHLSGKDEVVCCLPDNASITHLVSTGDSLELVELGRQIETHVN